MDDSTPYSRGQLVGAILGAIFGTAILLVSIVYFLRERSNSRYTPVRGEQDTAAAEFNFSAKGDSQPIALNLITPPRIQHGSYPSRDSGAQYPTWSSAASSGRARNYPRIMVTSPTTVPSASSFSTESHYNVYKSMYDSQNHLPSLATHEDTTYTGLPRRPSSPIPNRHARFGYLPVDGSDDVEADIPYDPTSRYDAPSLNSQQSLLDKMKNGVLPSVPIRSSGTAQPSHSRTESRLPLIQRNVAPQSSQPEPKPELWSQPQPQPSQPQSHIQLTSQPPPNPPKTQPLAPIIVPLSFQPPSHPPPKFSAVENIGNGPLNDSVSVNKQPPDAPRDKTRFSVHVPPTPVGPPHLPSSPPAVPETGTNVSLKSHASDASVEQLAVNPSANLTSPSTSYQAIPRPATKPTDLSDRSHTWYSAIDSSSSPSRQYSLDSPIPSSKALSHGTYGDKKEGLMADLISPVKTLSPDMTTPSTGGSTPALWEFPLPPGASPLQHTKSDPHPAVSAPAAIQPRARTKSSLSNIVATAADIEMKNIGVAMPTVAASPPWSAAEGSHSHASNGVISKGSKGGLMTADSSPRARKPIPPGFFDDPEDEQKKSELGTDMHGERVGRDANLVWDMPMILAGSLNTNGALTERQTNQGGGRTESAAPPTMEDSGTHPESLTSHASFLSDDENGTLERAEIKTAELAIRSPPRNVPELARWDTIHHMSDPEERARARSRSGSNATASGSTRKRKTPDYSPPPMPSLPMDVRERLGDSLDLSSRATSTIDGQLASIPMSLGATSLISPTPSVLPWTPSPAATPLRSETLINSASSQQTDFHPSDRPPWSPLRLHTPPRDEQRSPSTPPSVPPIPEMPPINFEYLMTERPPIQGVAEKPTLAEEQPSQAEPAVVTVHEASPRVSSDVNESGWQPSHTPGSSIHSQGTTDTFGLSTTKSVRDVPKGGRPRPGPTHDREPSASGASISSLVLSHNTGSHATSGSGSQNGGYAPSVDYIFGAPPPVPEQSEPDTASESHTTVPTPHKSSPKLAPAGLMTPIPPPTSTNPLSQTNVDTPFSSRGSVTSTPSSISTRPRAGSTRPSVGVRGPRERSSTRAVLPSSSGSSRGYSTSQTRPLSASSFLASYGRPPSLLPPNATDGSNSRTDSMVTTSNNSILDLYVQSPPPSNAPIPDPLSFPPNEHPQSHPP